MTTEPQPAANSTARRFRGRLIAAWFLQGLGGLMFLLGVLSLFAGVFLLFRHGRDAWSVLYEELIGLALYTTAGLLVIASGRLLLNKRRGWVVLTLLLAFAGCVSGSHIMQARQAYRDAALMSPLVPDETAHPVENRR